MEPTECPHCQQNTITFGQRLKALHWFNIYCPECGGKICMQPILIGILYFALVWNVSFFGFMAVYDSDWLYVAVIVALWLILDFFGYYIPLSRMRRPQPSQPS